MGSDKMYMSKVSWIAHTGLGPGLGTSSYGMGAYTCDPNTEYNVSSSVLGPRFTEEKAEAQSNDMTCLRTHRWERQGQKQPAA